MDISLRRSDRLPKELTRIIMEFVPEGYHEWRKIMNDCHAELVLSKNDRSWRRDRITKAKIQKYKLFTTESDIYAYMEERNEDAWNADIFKHSYRDLKFQECGLQLDGSDIYGYGYTIRPRSTFGFANTSKSKELTRWRDQRMQHLGKTHYSRWKSIYG